MALETSEKSVGADRSASPFRYPGGKAFLTKFLAEKLEAVPGEAKHYAEPFCGGAGAALLLLKSGLVQHLYLNDADVRVYSAWKAMVEETDRFLERLQNVELTLDAWHAASELVKRSAAAYNFDLGFATFYLNRTSRSGIVVGAGPIGGYEQTGKWKIDARFTRDTLANRVSWLGSVAAQISLTNQDALSFLHQARHTLPVAQTLFFIDPPYVKAGGRLYLNAMNEGKHIALSDIVQSGHLPHWVITYDDHPLIRSIYSEQMMLDLDVSYSLQSKRRENEILILPQPV